MSFFSETGNGSSKTPGFDFLPGQLVLNTWEVLEPLGRGGMGAVYRVYHRFLHKEMAMKTLRCDQVTEVTWRRFLIEAKAIAKLEHPNIVQIFDMGTAENGQPFYTMELLNGQGLDRWIRNEPLTVAQSIYVFRQVACALAFAHERGIIHRDIKPANIVLGFSEENRPPMVKVVDFGIARLGLEGQGLTKEGEVFGSPLYMSPEQASGLKVDQRSDVYSFGCAFYESLTGFPPFKGAGAFETMMMHLDKVAKPIELARPDIKFPAGLSALVQMLLAKNPDQRYSNASQIVQDLLQIERGLGLKVASRLQTASQTKLEDWIDSDEHQITEQLTIPLGRTGSQSSVKPGAGVFDVEVDVEVELDDEESLKSRKAKADSFRRRVVLLSCVGFILSFVLLGVILWMGSKYREEAASVALQSAYFSLDENQIEDLKKNGMSFDADKKYYRFDTSVEECIGGIAEISDKERNVKTWRPALGEVKVLKGRSIAFQPSRYLLAHPHLWRKFRSTDLQSICFPLLSDPVGGVSMRKYYTLSEENIRELARFELLEAISFQYADISPESAAIVGNFPHLRRLYFSIENTIPVSTILNMDCVRLGRLTRLKLPRLDDVGRVIALLEKSKRLQYLEIPYWDASLTDMARIASMRQLVGLEICGGRIPVGAIKQLSKLPALEYLGLRCTVCPQEVASEFLTLTHLKGVELSNDVWGNQKIHFNKLKQQLLARGINLIGGGSVKQIKGLYDRADVSQRAVSAGRSKSAAALRYGDEQDVESMVELIEEPELLSK